MYPNHRAFKQYLDGLAASGSAHRGFVASRSLFWRLNRDVVMHLAGPRALLLQLAHPKVAQGVGDHSNFQAAPFRRALQTFSLVYAIAFGTREQAVRAATRVYAVHDQVHGVLQHTAGLHRQGSFYDAHDPEPLLRVQATLIDSSLVAYSRFVRRLTAGEVESFYQDSRIFGRLFGIPEQLPPDDAAGFRRWFDRMVASNLIAVSPTGRRLARAVMSGPWALRPISPLIKAVTAGLLPSKLRHQYGLSWGLPARALNHLFVRAVKRSLPRLPEVMRVVPLARVAESRRNGT